ncbi:MAG: Ig-like domain-containing protein [Oscillospiraceae bacterium]|nr:Ig-like domain-containing protein [Oscillospiraceae bacterium]
MSNTSRLSNVRSYLPASIGAVKVTVNTIPKEIEAVSYTYTSADTNIATVDEEGNIKGLAVGETTVTVTTVNGLTASCKVIVEEPKPASFSVDSWRLSVWAKQYNTKATAKLKQRYPNRKLEDTLYIVTAVRGYDGGDDMDMIEGGDIDLEKLPKEYWDESAPDGYPYYTDKILITDDELNNETPGYDGKYRFTSSDESIVKINKYTGRIYMVATIDLKINPDDSCEFIPVNKTCRITVTNIEDDTSITLNVVLDNTTSYIQSDPNYKARYCAEMFRLVNEKRVENGLPELIYYFDGQERADQRAYNISKDFTHQHSGFEVMLKTGVGYRIYKDIHITQWSPEEAAKDDFDMWINSDAHRKILVENYATAEFDKYFVCSFCWPHGTRYAIANIYDELSIVH